MVRLIAIFFSFELAAASLNVKHCAFVARQFGITVTDADVALLSSARRMTTAELKAEITPPKFDERYVEFGPASSPHCKNCVYLQPGGAAAAVERAKEMGGEGKSIDGSAEALPFGPNSLKVIYASSLPWYNRGGGQTDLDQGKVLSEAFRVLEPGGSAYFVGGTGKTQDVPFPSDGMYHYWFDNSAERVVYREVDIIQKARAIGFEIQIIETEHYSGMKLTKR